MHRGAVKTTPEAFEQLRQDQQQHRLEQMAGGRNEELLNLEADHPFRMQHEQNLGQAQGKLAQFHIDKLNKQLAAGRPDTGRVHERTRDQYAALPQRIGNWLRRLW